MSQLSDLELESSNPSLLLGDERLCLHYQPKYSLVDGRMVGAEGLLRYEAKSGKVIPPFFLLPIFESAGLMTELALRSLETLANDYQELVARGCPMRLALNVTANDLRQSRLVDMALNLVNTGRVPAKHLEIEVVEGMTLVGDAEATEAVVELKKAGITIAMDDFGQGHSNLLTIIHTPVDVLKLDRAFVASARTDCRALEVSRNLRSLTTRLDLITLAEGVEEAADVALFQHLGYDEAQGYAFMRPAPLDQVRDAALAGPSALVGNDIVSPEVLNERVMQFNLWATHVREHFCGQSLIAEADPAQLANDFRRLHTQVVAALRDTKAVSMLGDTALDLQNQFDRLHGASIEQRGDALLVSECQRSFSNTVVHYSSILLGCIHHAPLPTHMPIA